MGVEPMYNGFAGRRFATRAQKHKTTSQIIF